MMNKTKTGGLALFAGVIMFGICTGLYADQGTPAEDLSKDLVKADVSDDKIFVEDRISVQVLQGALFSDSGIGPSIPDINYLQSNVRLGWMLNSAAYDESPLDGNVEVLLETSFSKVVGDLGDLMFGPTALIRYNFVQPDWFVVPYIQGGAGIVYTDIYEHPDQRAVGQAVEFTPTAGAGAHFIIDKNWMVDLEFRFQHVSNAGMGDRNLGINAIGGFLGFTYFFDKLWK